MLNCLYINIELGVSLKKKNNSRQDPNPSRLRVHDIGDLLSSMNITRISQLNSVGLNTPSPCDWLFWTAGLAPRNTDRVTQSPAKSGGVSWSGYQTCPDLILVKFAEVSSSERQVSPCLHCAGPHLPSHSWPYSMQVSLQVLLTSDPDWESKPEQGGEEIINQTVTSPSFSWTDRHSWSSLFQQ